MDPDVCRRVDSEDGEHTAELAGEIKKAISEWQALDVKSQTVSAPRGHPHPDPTLRRSRGPHTDLGTWGGTSVRRAGSDDLGLARLAIALPEGQERRVVRLVAGRRWSRPADLRQAVNDPAAPPFGRTSQSHGCTSSGSISLLRRRHPGTGA